MTELNLKCLLEIFRKSGMPEDDFEVFLRSGILDDLLRLKRKDICVFTRQAIRGACDMMPIPQLIEVDYSEPFDSLTSDVSYTVEEGLDPLCCPPRQEKRELCFEVIDTCDIAGDDDFKAKASARLAEAGLRWATFREFLTYCAVLAWALPEINLATLPPTFDKSEYEVLFFSKHHDCKSSISLFMADCATYSLGVRIE